jgi:hypothetical protein
MKACSRTLLFHVRIPNYLMILICNGAVDEFQVRTARYTIEHIILILERAVSFRIILEEMRLTNPQKKP